MNFQPWEFFLLWPAASFYGCLNTRNHRAADSDSTLCCVALRSFIKFQVFPGRSASSLIFQTVQPFSRFFKNKWISSLMLIHRVCFCLFSYILVFNFLHGFFHFVHLVITLKYFILSDSYFYFIFWLIGHFHLFSRSDPEWCFVCTLIYKLSGFLSVRHKIKWRTSVFTQIIKRQHRCCSFFQNRKSFETKANSLFLKKCSYTGRVDVLSYCPAASLPPDSW